MGTTELDWLVTLFAVHFLALVAVLYIFKGAPCWMQRVSLILLILAFMGFCGGYLAALMRLPYWWTVLAVAAVMEHFAVLIYVFRVWWQTEENKWKSSISSRGL